VQQGYEAGIYSLKEAQEQMRDLRAQIAALNKQAAQTKTKTGWVTRTFLDYYGMNLSAKRAFIGAFIDNVVVGPAISRGNQPFDPARFEVHFTDGQVLTLDGAIDLEDV
jgi:hypothetical protein